MVRADLVHSISLQLDTSERNAEKILVAVLEGMKEGIRKDGDLIIRGFGRFKVQHKKARMGRNPKTGDPAKITARKRVAFKSSKRFQEVLA
tara:strand:- start:1689 stop:1961 length:273 start_codon:yes stop_codon:yes gene_type:complete